MQAEVIQVNQAIVTQILVALPAIIAAAATLIVTIRSNKNVKKIEVATNSMKDALVKATETEALARGNVQGRAAEKANPTVGEVAPTDGSAALLKTIKEMIEAAKAK